MNGLDILSLELVLENNVRSILPVLFACLGFLPTSAVLQAAPAPLPAAAGQELRGLVDEVVTTQLFLNDIPGAAVALVGDGRVLYLNGYGYADRAARTRVSAERTLFGTGSVSKLFTWTAVMQLVEQGVLELDRDINDYLDAVRIPPTWPQPVTLAHLMTHTAGFEKRVFGFYARSSADLVPLQTFLAGHLPARAFPPGKVSAYSNFGAALAGHIVARASGMPFERYIETRILEPLGMSHSSFRQPLPTALAPDLATGHHRSDGEPGREWYQARPSGALKATAADMARFMIATLQQGRLGNTRILQPASSTAMLQRQFSNHPAVSGLTYGLLELQRGGQRLLWQPGDTRLFTSALYLLPEQGLGLFVTYNRAGMHHPRLELLDAILARLQPGWQRPAPPPENIDSGHRVKTAGSYRSTRTGQKSLERLLEPFTLVHVREAGEGTLHISGLAMVEDTLWVEQSPGVFRDTGSDEIVVFHTDSDTGTTWLFEGNAPAFGYARLPWYATPAVQAVLLGYCALVFLVTLIAWSLRRPGPERYPAPVKSWSTRLTRPVAAALCMTNLAFLGGLVLVAGQAQQLLFGIPPFVQDVLLLPVVSAVLAVPTTTLALGSWRNVHWTRAQRLHLTLVAATGLLFAGLLHYWQLL